MITHWIPVKILQGFQIIHLVKNCLHHPRHIITQHSYKRDIEYFTVLYDKTDWLPAKQTWNYFFHRAHTSIVTMDVCERGISRKFFIENTSYLPDKVSQNPSSLPQLLNICNFYPVSKLVMTMKHFSSLPFPKS